MFLLIGPGDSSTRESIYANVKNKPVFNKTAANLTKQYASIYKRKIFTISRLDGKSKEEIKEKLSLQLNKFLETEYLFLEKELIQLNKAVY